jgi:Region found in RelA / SpoT proteins
VLKVCKKHVIADSIAKFSTVAHCSAHAGLVWGDGESPTSSSYTSSSSDDSVNSYAAAQHDKEMCYRVLEAVHAVLQPVSPPRVKDYIAFPKSNGYTSLHTTVFLLGYPVEVQVTEYAQFDNFKSSNFILQLLCSHIAVLVKRCCCSTIAYAALCVSVQLHHCVFQRCFNYYSSAN